jgi:renal tumor antigen
LRKKGEGSFSEVIEAIHIISKKRVAIKCMKKTFESLELVNKLREIQTLKKISPHDNIVELREIL